MSDPNDVPEGFRTATPMLVIKNAREALEFYQKAFGAVARMKLTGPNDSIVHAELGIGDSVIMIGEESPGYHVRSPKSVQGTTCSIYLYVDDVDKSHQRAIESGATEIMPPQDMFWGDRYSSVSDPFGHAWSLGTHIRDVSEEECQRACDEWMAQMAGAAEE